MPQFNFSSRLVWRKLILLRVFNCYVSTTEHKIRRFMNLGSSNTEWNHSTSFRCAQLCWGMLLTYWHSSVQKCLGLFPYLGVEFCIKEIKNTTVSSEGTWSVFHYDWLEILCNELHQTVARAVSQRIVVHENHNDAKSINTSPYMLAVFPSNTFCWYCVQ
jgi:hypothetical protein